jgi:hypothetical protein
MRPTYSRCIATRAIRSAGRRYGSGTELLMMAWLTKLLRRRDDPIWTELRVAPVHKPFAGPAEYLPLHTYLRDRYANIVVLTFAEIEDLLGCSLPAVARLQADWWADGGTPSAQSRTWSQARRTVTANLRSETAIFERAQA